MNSVILLIGSNLGHRHKNILLANYHIRENVGAIIACSQIYETAPWCVTHKTAYLNQVLKIQTPLSPFALLHSLNKIEKNMGRKNKLQNAPRTIDIDILFYNNLIFRNENLEIPHPRLHLRRFTLVPLLEVAESYTHPILGKSIEELLNTCKDDSKVSIFMPS